MKVSQINQEVILSHLREQLENLDYCEVELLDVFKKASIEYCKNQTGMTELELDEHEDITVAVLVLISDMWDNRDMVAQNDKENKVVNAILSCHRTNLLPSAGVI